MAASPPRLIIAFTSMCQMWVSKSNCESRMTLRNWHVLDKKMLLTYHKYYIYTVYIIYRAQPLYWFSYRFSRLLSQNPHCSIPILYRSG